MWARSLFSVLLALLLIIPAKCFSQSSPYPSDLKGLPIIFLENKGQWDSEVLFKAVNSNSQVYFSKHKIYFTHSRRKNSNLRTDLEHFSWNCSFIGSQKNVTVKGTGKTRQITNYIVGSNTSKLSDYSTLFYNGLYPNIDLRYYTQGPDLKYDYILHPGFDITNIKIKYDGVEKVWIENGELNIKHKWGVVKEKKPYSYQIINGQQKEVKISYSINESQTIGFKIESEYDPLQEIILDPVTLVWGTYVGGNNPSNGGYLYDLTTDIAGNIYATGYYPNTFPVTDNSYDNSFNGGYGDIFVFKLNSAGSSLEYATYIGGNDDDRGYGIAVNKSGEAFITGYTASAYTSFPVTKTFGVGLTGKNTFVCKLNSDGSSLLYSVYIGGLDHDIGNGIVVDNNDNVYVTGETQSTNFPVTSGALKTSFSGLPADGFVFKLNSSGTTLNYSSYLGGSSDDRARALAINSNNEVFITGITNSSDFPVSSSCYDNSFNGGYDVFALKLNNTGTAAIYSTYIGGSAAEEGTSIDINLTGDAFITGYSYSLNYPKTTGDPLKGLQDVIVTRLNQSGTALVYSRYIGGSAMDEGTSIIINAKDQAFVCGATESTDFPLVQNGSNVLDPSRDKKKQVFALMLGENGDVIKKSIRLGGSYDDYEIPNLSFPDKNAICNVVIGFTSHSPDLLTTAGTFQPNKLNGDQTNDQPAVFKLYFGPDSLPKFSPTFFNYCPKNRDDELTLCGPDTYDPDYPLTYHWSTGETSKCINIKMKDANVTLSYSNGCETKQRIFSSDSFNLPKALLGPDVQICKNGSISLSANAGTNLGPDVNYVWSTGATSESITVYQEGTYWVKVFTSCGYSSDTIVLHTIDVPLNNLGPDKSFCFPGNYTLNGYNPADTVNPRSYLWSTKATTPTISIDSGGTYWLDITNQCGTVRDYITINELHKPILNLGNDTSICQNTAVVLNTGNPNLPTLWSTGATTQTISVSTPGIYWAEVTDVCGKTRDSIVIKYAPSVPIVNLGPDKKICSSFSLTLDAGNSTTGSNYYWSTGDNSETINISSGGVYFVTVTNGCGTGRDTINITSLPSLNLDLGLDQVVCSPQTVTLKANNPGGTPHYQWSTGATSQSIVASTTGTYWVKVTNECGSASDTAKIKVQNNKPIVNIGKDTSICAGTDFILDAKNPGETYLWNTTQTSQTIIANITAKDTFWVDVSNACGTTRDSIILDIQPIPSVDLGPDTSICSPSKILLNAFNNNASYNWSTGATTSSIIATSTGKYYVDVTRCATVSDTVYVTVNNTLPKITLGKDTTICTNFTLTLDAGDNPGSEYLWLPDSQTTRTINVSTGKMYKATVINGCGASSDSINIIGQPYKNLGPDVSACKFDTIVLDAGNQWSHAKYLWNTNDTTQKIKVHSSGEYIVEVVNICGITHDTILVSMDTVKCKVDLGPDQRICSPATITLDAGNPGSKYSWSTGEKTRTITVNATGKYKVEVINGCGITPDSLFLRVDSNVPHVNLGPDTNICSPVYLVLDSKNLNSIYNWFPGGQVTQKITVTSGGVYSVKVINACGYDSTGLKVSEFTDPKVELGNDMASCANAVLLDAGNPGDKYFWSTGETTEQISATSTGSYKVNVYNVCGIASDSIFVAIDNGLPQVALGKDTMFCSPSGLTLNSGSHPLANILWSPGGETTEAVHVTVAGIYSVVVTNSCGTNSDDLKIDPNPIIVNAVPDTSICPGNKVSLSTTFDSHYKYIWTPGGTLNNDTIYNPITLPLDTTTYKVEVTDGVCTNIDSATVIVYPILNPHISANPIEGYVPLGVTFSNTHPAPNQLWLFGDGDSSTATKPTHVYNKEGIFKAVLIATTSNGCIELDTIEIRPFSLFIPNLITPNGDGFNDRFDLTSQYVWLYVEIYNRWGNLIFKKEDGYIDDWDGKGCDDGIYYYYILDKRYKREFKGWVQVTRSSRD